MTVRLNLVVLIVLLSSMIGNSQTLRGTISDPFQNYYYDYKLANPALTGMHGKHAITTSYLGRPGDVDLFYASYEARVPGIGSAVGVTAMLGDMFSLRTYNVGGLFSKQIKFKSNSGLFIGTHVYYKKRIINSDAYRPLSPDDPLIISDDRSSASAGADFGVAYNRKKLILAAGVKNIRMGSVPEEFGGSQSEFTSFNFLVSHEFVITPAIEVVPSCLLVTNPNGSLAGLNATAKIHKWFMVGAGNRFRNSSSEFSFNVGINIKDWVQIITHCYSSTNQKYEFDKPYVETLLRITVPERVGVEGK